ncbi:MAG TPA: hypothetical protein VFI29_06265 [Hanamia sp.]|nr:hypothetical protein [Hanamia sp.]
MRNIFGSLLILVFSVHGNAQDNEKKWQPYAELNFTSIPTINISGTDTLFQNTLSITPSIGIRNQNGFGIVYAPSFIASGQNSGIFMHTFTVGIEQYDKKKFDFIADFNHFFFTGNNSISYTPISNEIILGATYKKLWLMPKLYTSFGFGTNKEGSPSATAYDIYFAAGAGHTFSCENKNFSFDITPSLMLNAGTNEYFSFLGLSKYIWHNKKFTKIVKNYHGRNNRGDPNNQQNPTQQFSLSNLELNLESEFEMGSFALRPSGSLFFPISSTGTGIDGYWECTIAYNF